MTAPTVALPTATPPTRQPADAPTGISFAAFLALSPAETAEFMRKAGGQAVTVRIPRQPVLKSAESKSA